MPWGSELVIVVKRHVSNLFELFHGKNKLHFN